MLYINDFCSIGPMGVFRPDTDISGWEAPEANNADRILYAREPDYREWISPIKQRRMSKSVRMAVAAMKMCFDTDVPASIHIGSGFGQLSDSQRFLETMMVIHQGALSPTSFIQSTHNTVSGALGMEAGAHGHNFTFANAGHSFEDAFFDAALTNVDLNYENDQLIGAVDEMIPVAARTLRQNDTAGSGILPSLGEGCSVFRASSRREPDIVGHIMAFQKVLTGVGGQNIHRCFDNFMKTSNIRVRNDDLWIRGNSSAKNVQVAYKDFRELFFKGNPVYDFKRFCGDYPTHSAFGLAYALACLNRQPEFGRAWLITNSGHYWSFWLLEK
ncbi:MAG TPA: beta-ketoacyl synthase chain length factor [Edaphocola sp.]|nr:beta-ketoacyl synthase chain length factor [Edaphocola sp.]